MLHIQGASTVASSLTEIGILREFQTIKNQASDKRCFLQNVSRSPTLSPQAGASAWRSALQN